MNFNDYSWKEIIERNSNIVFWGMGKKFDSFIQTRTEWSRYTRIIIDNDKSRSGKLICGKGYEIPVVSLDTFIERYNSSDFLLIISVGVKNIPGIIEQINKYPILSNINYCIADFIIEKDHNIQESCRKYPSSFKITRTPLIPKKIHYCWFGKGKIPEKNLNWMKSWQRYCPDYEIIRWDESNYDVKKNRFMREAYEAGKWGFVPDYARFDVIYHEGGIYLDTDVELIKNIDDLLYQDGFMGTEDGKYVSPGLGFGSIKNNDFIKELMGLYKDISFDINNMIPSPTFLLNFFKQKGWDMKGNYKRLNGMTILPEKVLSPKNNRTGSIFVIPQTYSIHHFDGSWVDDTVKTDLHKGFNFFKQIHK